MERSAFQSLKGFQPRWNLSEVLVAFEQSDVSIPKRVSAKVEPGILKGSVIFGRVSIPKRVSAKVEPLAVVYGARITSGFNP